MENVREQIEKELKNGVTVTALNKKYNVPTSTICTWLAHLKRRGEVDLSQTKAESAKNNACLINSTEAKIANIISPYIIENLSDSEWIHLQKKIIQELQDIVFEAESKKPDSCNMTPSDIKKIKAIVKRWNENKFISKYEFLVDQ